MSYLKELIDSRELLVNLTMREVRGQYKRTFFGQLWSLANPIAQMVIYTFVFSFIFRVQPSPGEPSGLNVFALWLMCGLLPWTFFSNLINKNMSSIVDNAGLIQKVYFARIVLPLSTVGSASYNMVFEMAVLLAALVVFGSFIWPWIPLLILFLGFLALFGAGIGMVLAIANVHFRDTQYLTGILLNFWMFLTPIMYPITLIEEQSLKVGPLFGTQITLLDVYTLNPLERFVSIFRALLYDNRLPQTQDMFFVTVATVLSISLGMWVFAKNERRLAEAL